MTVQLAVRADRDQLRAALAGTAGGHLGPAEDRWCGVLPAAGADPDEVAAAVSRAVGGPVVVARVGPDLDLRLFLYGSELARYRTGDAAAGAATPADVERLIDATGARVLPGDLAPLLADPAADAAARYAALVRVLGLPGYLAGLGDAVPPFFEPVRPAGAR